MNTRNGFADFTRRSFLTTGTAALTAMRALAAAPVCTLNSEQEEGPYYVEAAKLRSDVTEAKPGIPLHLRVALVNAKTCQPLENAACDIWHCDATGVYSGFTAQGSGGPGGPGGGGRGPGGPPPGFGPGGPGGPGGPPPDFNGRGRGPGGPGGRGQRNIDATRFLRGIQMTNKSGLIEFATIYPGWYQGRTIHIHMKVHLAGQAGGTNGDTYNGGHVSHTGQLFFPEDITERIANLEPYASNARVHRTLHAEDEVFSGQHGAEGMMTLDRFVRNGGDTAGFVATATIAVDPDATPAPTGPGGGGPGGRGRGPG